MEVNLTQRRRGLLEKIPDIEKTLKVVDFMLERKTKVSTSPVSAFPALASGHQVGSELT